MAKSLKKSGSYHHGNLREALIEAAIQLVEEVGPDNVSVREAAKRAGVSPGAPFRHFANKNAFWLAIDGRAVHSAPEAPLGLHHRFGVEGHEECSHHALVAEHRARVDVDGADVEQALELVELQEKTLTKMNLLGEDVHRINEELREMIVFLIHIWIDFLIFFEWEDFFGWWSLDSFCIHL